MLLLNEPSIGVASTVVEQVFETIRMINAQGVTVLLVEQNALMALSIADSGYVPESGRVILHGKASDPLHDERVRRAYLG
jgi:branched-chain amino acid transport system ATP-binding protein